MTRRVSQYEMIEVDQAINIILDKTQYLDSVEVDLADALGFVIAEKIFAREPMPPFRASIMDGYCVKSIDGIGEYPVIGTSSPGSIPSFTVKEKTIAKVSTGAPIPDGADAVVKVEDTLLLNKDENGNDIVRIEAIVKEGNFIRPIGSDIEVGALALEPHTLLGPPEIGLLASLGICKVKVFRSPTVGVMSTGDELVNFDESLVTGKIRDSNRPTLLAFLNEQNVETVNMGISKDTFGTIEENFLKALEKVDILITTGGVSMGEMDLIKPLLAKHGQIHFGRLNMKPGKPTTFASVNYKGSEKLVFGLPGNPVSSAVTFNLLLLPCIRKMRGHLKPHLTKVMIKIMNDLKLDSERPEYHRVIVQYDLKEGCYIAHSTGNQLSSRLLSMISSNGLVLLPKGTGVAKSGSFVEGILTGPI